MNNAAINNSPDNAERGTNTLCRHLGLAKHSLARLAVLRRGVRTRSSEARTEDGTRLGLQQTADI